MVGSMGMIGSMTTILKKFGKWCASLKKIGPTWQRSLARPPARLKRSYIVPSRRISYRRYPGYSRKKKGSSEKGESRLSMITIFILLKLWLSFENDSMVILNQKLFKPILINCCQVLSEVHTGWDVT